MPNRPRYPLRSPYQPPTGLSGARPQASTVPSAAGFFSSAAPRGTQPSCPDSHACRSSTARKWYLRVVEPTWQTSAGGSACGSWYIEYSDVPGGVFSSHGSSLVPAAISGLLIRDCCRKVRQERLPPDSVTVPPGARAFAQAFPAAVFDLDPGIAWAPGDEPDIDVGGRVAVPAQVPQVGQPLRGIPDGHDAPVVLDPLGGPFVDPAADAAFQHDGQVPVAGDRVIRRPPRPDPRRPHGERVLGRAGHVEGDAQRRGHCRPSGSEFSASSRNRTAASPHTRSR